MSNIQIQRDCFCILSWNNWVSKVLRSVASYSSGILWHITEWLVLNILGQCGGPILKGQMSSSLMQCNFPEEWGA